MLRAVTSHSGTRCPLPGSVLSRPLLHSRWSVAPLRQVPVPAWACKSWHPALLTGTVVQHWWEWFGVGGRLVGPSRCTATAFQFGSPVVTQMCTSAGVQSVGFYCLWVVLARRVLNCIFFGEVCILSCRHIVKRSRSQVSHFFNIHLTSIHFTLVRLLTCHQAGLYLKQI